MDTQKIGVKDGLDAQVKATLILDDAPLSLARCAISPDRTYLPTGSDEDFAKIYVNHINNVRQFWNAHRQHQAALVEGADVVTMEGV
jgi:hypothetical protein